MEVIFSQLEGRLCQYWLPDGAVQMVGYCCTETAILPLDGAVRIARARGKTQSFIGRLSY